MAPLARLGFAPCKAEARANLIQLLDGVEGIPGSAMTDGIAWEYQSFPEYMNAVEKIREFWMSEIRSRTVHCAPA